MATGKKISVCPNCNKPVEAKEFLTSLGGGIYHLGAISNWFVCEKCGYKGPAVELSFEKYKKLVSKKKK